MIAEPMTMLTDYALAAVTGWLGWRLLRARAMHIARLWWAIALIALALAAILGGSYHGFAPLLGASTLNLLWKAAVLVIGVAALGMMAGSAHATTAGSPRKLLLVLAAGQFLLYAAWMMGHDDYIFVVADTAAAMAALVILHAWSYAVRRDPASAWMLAAVAVSALAAAVQASGLALHQDFNHNDLYHVIQIAAMTLFYTGAKLLRDHSTD